MRKDGSRFWASVVIDAIHDDETGELLGFAKITRDITEWHETQRQLKTAQEQLAASQKMEAVGQLSGGIAHDFNNLLMIVIGNIENAQRHAHKPPANPALTRALGNAMRGAQRAAALTRRLLAFSRRQALDPKPIDVNKFLSGAARFSAALARRDRSRSRRSEPPASGMSRSIQISWNPRWSTWRSMHGTPCRTAAS